MPLYGYKCGDCDHEFSDVRKVDERRKPTEEPCPNCGESGKIDMMIGSPRIVAGVGNLHSKISDNFKDRLKEIKKMSGRGCTIET